MSNKVGSNCASEHDAMELSDTIHHNVYRFHSMYMRLNGDGDDEWVVVVVIGVVAVVDWGSVVMGARVGYKDGTVCTVCSVPT